MTSISTPISSAEQLQSLLPLPQYQDKLILIIEAEPITRTMFAKTLQEAGYHIITVAAIEEAWPYFKQVHVDVVITDLFLSHQGGLNFLNQIKSQFPEIAVILTTTEASVETSVAALRQGATDYLIKPISPTELRYAVERAFGQQRQAQKNNYFRVLDELETLRTTSELFLNNLSQEEVLSIVGDRALQVSQADYCEIFTTHPDGKDFISTIQLPETKDLPPEIKTLSHKLALEAIQRQEIIIVNQPQSTPAILQSWLILLFKVSGNIVGALCLGHHKNQALPPSIIKLLLAFVDQASIAISNAQLFEDLTQAYTKLSHSRAKILESKNTLQTLFDGISDGLYIIDQDFNIIMVNQAEVNHLQLCIEDILSQTFSDLGWQEGAPKFIDLIKQTFTTGEKAHWIPDELNKFHLVNNREMQLYPIVSPQDIVQQMIILAQDVTHQKQLQASLFQSANLAAIGQLATSIAHEINNPLTITLTNTQLLMADLEPADEMYEIMEDIYYAGNRIKNIVNNLVDFSNQDIYQFDQVNLVETIEDTLTIIGHPIRKAKIKIERVYNHTPTIVASRNHLKMAWMNLLLNACDAIRATKKPGEIIITIDQKTIDVVNVHIADTGVGIPDSYAKNIFSPFFTTKPIGHAVGLGLFTTRTIIEKHHGTITFQSTPGETIFSTILPENALAD